MYLNANKKSNKMAAIKTALILITNLKKSNKLILFTLPKNQL